MSTSTVFTGTSRFSADFSQVIQRSVSIASLPLTLLQQQKTKTDDQSAALKSLNIKVSTLQSSVLGLTNGFGAGSFSTTNSNPNAAAVTAGESATTGSWDVSVNSLGASTAFVVTGFPAVANPSADVYTSGASQTLLVDLDPTDGNNDPVVMTLYPAGQTLTDLVAEINKAAGNMVQASIVNVGSTSSPNYQLSLQSRTLGPVDITLTDGATQSTNSPALRGSLATYTVNGAAIATDSRTVTLSPGITLDLKQTTSSPFTVSVNRSADSISNVLNNFINAYNNVVAEVDQHYGNKDAALSGDSILGTTQSTMRRLLTSIAPSGDFSSLASLGVGFDSNGKLYLDNEQFKKATDGKIDQVKSFFGTLDGSGFIKTANGVLDSLTQSSTGILSSAISSADNSSKAEAKHISEQQDYIDRLEQRLQAQMAAADAAIAMLEQQVTYLSGMWDAMKTASKSSS
jgi:flagellar hook-associated protein 2